MDPLFYLVAASDRMYRTARGWRGRDDHGQVVALSLNYTQTGRVMWALPEHAETLLAELLATGRAPVGMHTAARAQRTGPYRLARTPAEHPNLNAIRSLSGEPGLVCLLRDGEPVAYPLAWCADSLALILNGQG